MGTCTLDIEDNGRIWFSILSNLTFKNPIDMTGRGRGRASGPPGPPGPPPGPPGGLRQRPPAPRQPPPPPTRVEPTFVGSGESISSGSASTPSTEMSPPSTVLDITQTRSFTNAAQRPCQISRGCRKVIQRHFELLENCGYSK